MIQYSIVNKVIYRLVKQIMSFKNRFALGCGRTIYKLMRMLGRQASTFPGKFALRISKEAFSYAASQRDIVCITGTNGKTTTTSVAVDLLRNLGVPVTTNHSGANLKAGLLTAMMVQLKDGITVLEIDEAAFASCAAELDPKAVVVTNIFADQLDRYGSIDAIRELIQSGCAKCKADLVLCADDPRVTAIGEALKERTIVYYGAEVSGNMNSDSMEKASVDESADCPNCGTELSYNYHTIRQQGDYYCSDCSWQRPQADYVFTRNKAEQILCIKANGKKASSKFPLDGLYNAYNATAAVALIAHLLPNQPFDAVVAGLATTKPQFGRLERFSYKDKEVCFLLVKNPAGLEQSVRLVLEQDDIGGMLFFLNNKPADGADPSWIWQADLNNLPLPPVPLGAGGMCAKEMATLLQDWSDGKQEIIQSLDNHSLVMEFLELCPPGKCLYLMPNYTVMLSLREELAPTLGFEKSWE